MIPVNRKDINNGWSFCSTLWKLLIVMVYILNLSAIRRDVGVETEAELYSHADTSMFGAGSIVIDDFFM